MTKRKTPKPALLRTMRARVVVSEHIGAVDKGPQDWCYVERTHKQGGRSRGNAKTEVLMFNRELAR